MTTQDLAIVKERIAKLLAMAADVSSPNEAAIAAERARKLMDKYQISDLDVTAKTDGTFATVPAREKFEDYIAPWMATLGVSIAQYNDCQARYEGGYYTKGSGRRVWGKRIVFSGFADDAALASAMYQYLYDAIVRLAKEYLKKRGQGHSYRLVRNFGIAAVHEISHRIDAKGRERDQVMSTGTSLVLVKAKAVEEEFGGIEYRTRKGVDLHGEGYAAALAGQQAGRTIAIHPELEED
jgi:Protein of unknown function (DUF2786)